MAETQLISKSEKLVPSLSDYLYLADPTVKKLQVSNLLKLTEGFNCMISLNESSGVMTAILNDGTVITNSNDIGKLLNDVLAVLPDPCTILILPSTTPYPVGAASGTTNITKDTSIFAYGVTLKCDTNHTGGGEVFKVTVNQKSLFVFGMTLDINKLYANGFGGGTGAMTYAPRTVYVKDVIIKNIYNFGVEVIGKADLSEIQNVWLENVIIDAGNSNSLNEAILVNSVTKLTMRNIKTLGNKSCYVTADTVRIDHYEGSSIGYTSQQDLDVHATNALITDVKLTDLTLTLRPFTRVELTDTSKIINGAKRLKVDGYTSNNTLTGAAPIEVMTMNDVSTGNIEELILHNINVTRGEIVINNFFNTHGKINLVDIQNFKMDTFSGNKCLLVVEDNDIDILRMQNVIAPPTMSTDSAAVVVRVQVPHASSVISLMDLANITPEPSTNLIRVTDSASALSSTIKLLRPLTKGISTVITAGTPTVNLSLYQNAGTATIPSGQTSVAVTHGLAFTPTLKNITVGLGANPTNDPGIIWVSNITSSQFTLNCRADPGASGLSLGWRAGAP